MHSIFVNLKRFDVPELFGGICPSDSPRQWIEHIVTRTVELGLGNRRDIRRLVYLLPESLLGSAWDAMQQFPANQIEGIEIGCQGVHRKDVGAGANFGAFTTNRPAAAMAALDCTWAIIGHSEERADKLELIGASEKVETREAHDILGDTLREEVRCALSRGMRVLFCIGETAEEKGEGAAESYAPRVQEVLFRQLRQGLNGLEDAVKKGDITVGYEPIWAIGPGKTPPGREYIEFVGEYIQRASQELFGSALPVVYGGGLKEENATEIGSSHAISGGLVALTRFTPPIGFHPEDLVSIVARYQEGVKKRNLQEQVL